MNQVQKVYKLLTGMKSRSVNGFSLKDNPMILNNERSGYDPDQYDDEPSDYVNSEAVYTADDLSRDSASEFGADDDDLDEDDDVLDNEDDDFDDTDVDEDDPINDDVSDYPSSDPEAGYQEGKKPVYIKDMPYIDHATPGVTSH